MASQFSLKPQAATGFSNASEYDSHRPTYPPAAVSSLLSNLHLSGLRGAKIIDLACGTGKFTELLAQREEGFEIVGVEPHEGMRGELVKKALKGVDVREGNAGDMGLQEGWADGVVVAQAFHWFANEESLKEIHRVLKPGGALGLIWNIEDYNSPKDYPATTSWEQTLKDITASLEDGQARYRHGAWRQVFEDQLSSSPLQALKDTFSGEERMPKFSLPLGEDKVKWTVWLSDEAVWARYRTLSQIAVLEGEKLEEVKKTVFEALKGQGTERNEKGEVGIHGFTHFVWTERI